MNYLLGLLKGVGDFIDKAVPFAVGARTKIAVVACPVLAQLTPGLVAVAPVVAPVLPIVHAALCSAAPLLALAGLVRDKK